MSKSRNAKHLKDIYRFAGFYPAATVIGVFGDHKARVVRLTRREKKRRVARVGTRSVGGTIASRFGGTDRSEESMNEFYRFLGPQKSTKIRLAVMDMWKAFRISANKNAPQAAILFDKFNVLRHLGEALDAKRGRESFSTTGERSSNGNASSRTEPIPAFRRILHDLVKISLPVHYPTFPMRIDRARSSGVVEGEHGGDLSTLSCRHARSRACVERDSNSAAHRGELMISLSNNLWLIYAIGVAL